MKEGASIRYRVCGPENNSLFVPFILYDFIHM